MTDTDQQRLEQAWNQHLAKHEQHRKILSDGWHKSTFEEGWRAGRCSIDLSAFADRLHERIMGMPDEDPHPAEHVLTDEERVIYKTGHRDARLAAAELALAMVAELIGGKAKR